MAGINIVMRNEARIARAWKNAPAEMGKAIAQAIQVAGVFMTGKTKEYIRSGTGMWKSPFDTGQMMRGIHPIFESTKAYIRPSSITPYAMYVHEGTKHMRARPFFEITAEGEKERVGEQAMKIIERALKTLQI